MMGLGLALGLAWSEGFAPPATDPNFSSVSLLLHFDGGNGSTTFTDSSSAPKTVTPINTSLTTAVKKYGTASAYFNGVNAFASVPDDAGFDVGAGAFCTEGWVNPEVAVTTRMNIFYQFDGTSGFGVAILDTGKLRAFVQNAVNGVVFVGPGPTTVPDNVWSHWALTCDGTTLRLFLNGVLEASAARPSSGVGNSSAPLEIGAETAGAARQFKGWMDDFRFTKGVARYTANFTPPTAAFPNA